MSLISRDVLLLWLAASILPGMAQVTIPHHPVGSAPPLPPGKPHPPPAYMKDNTNNFFGSAPDKGSLNGPVLEALNQSKLDILHRNYTLETGQNGDDYWLSTLGAAGQMPFAPSGYQFFRNVKDFGAAGDGQTDDTAAINRAAATYGLNDLSSLRCGQDCGSTTTLGAVVYFPPGEYLISTPIVQYYYTQFVGHPTSKPTIKGSFNFTGIALFDSDVYIPDGNSQEWYINQSNFYRQIRNFKFDMTGMNWTNHDAYQGYVPVGIHWQVGQATSVTYCDFDMAVSDGPQAATAIGIYMENGSGGFVSDLTFFGGNIGFMAGSQQFTANNLQFTSCLTAIKQVFNWGFTWKNIYVLSCYIALDCTAYSGITNQGTGSIAVLDSHFNGVPYAITIANRGTEQPNIVLDNLLVENSQAVVLISGAETILPGSIGPLYFNSWANGFQYFPNGSGGKRRGFIDPAPSKPAGLLDGNGAYFTRSKPQYAGQAPVVATDSGVSNDGTGDQTQAINSLLSGNVGSLIFFPGGIYLVEGTIHVPVGSIIIGSGWSQIMATGSYFADAENPKVVVQVGSPGDSGVLEISDMLFTVKGATAGAILVEWNVHEAGQGSAAMWDSHFRVGGAIGTDLQHGDCASGASSVNSDCMAAYMLMHMTPDSSGYLENIWAWVADHDLDNKANAEATESPEGIPLNVLTQISIYVGRGMLIESQGPTWLYGTASEHSQMYQYQLLSAKNIFLGVMQTETPYYQPNPTADGPYTIGKDDSLYDPTFENCANDYCKKAWALRVLNSSDVYIYGEWAGFYSFFQDNSLGCTGNEDCQLSLIEIDYTAELWLYNVFTKGNVQIISPDGGRIAPLLFNSTTRNGYTSEIAAWLALAQGGSDIGGPGSGFGSNDTGSGYVTIDPDLWTLTSPAPSSVPTEATVKCVPPCTYVLPPLTLSANMTFSFPLLTTSLTVGYNSTTSLTSSGITSASVTFVEQITTTVIMIPAVTTSVIPWYEFTVSENTTIIYPEPSIQPPPFNITDPTSFGSTTFPPSTRTFYPPPWPGSSISSTTNPTQTSSTTTSSSTTSGGGFFFGLTSVHHTRGPPSPTCTHAAGCGHRCNSVTEVCTHCYIGCAGIGGGFAGFNGPDPDQPGGVRDPNDPDDEECETSTYSSCSTRCVITTAASTTATQTCSTTCRDVVGCSTSGTETTSLTTSSQSCPIIPPYTPWWTATTQLAPILGDGNFGGYYVYGSMDPSTTGTSNSASSTRSASTSSGAFPTTTGGLPVDPPEAITFALYSDDNCQDKVTTIDLDTFDECVVPQPNTGWLSMTVQMPESDLDMSTLQNFPWFNISGLNQCEDAKVGIDLYTQNIVDTMSDSGCITGWRAGGQNGGGNNVTASFVATALVWLRTRDDKVDGSTPTEHAIPTSTAIASRVVKPLCYDFSYPYGSVEFTIQESNNVTGALCAEKYSLEPDNDYGFVEELTAGDIQVIAQFKWAEEQSGCGEKGSFSLPSDKTECHNVWAPMGSCEGEQSPRSYGGEYVFKNGDKGCILFNLQGYPEANTRAFSRIQSSRAWNSSADAPPFSEVGISNSTWWSESNSTRNADDISS